MRLDITWPDVIAWWSKVEVCPDFGKGGGDNQLSGGVAVLR